MPISTLQLTNKGVLKFHWKDEEEGKITLIFNNRLNHRRIGACSFSHREFQQIPAVGIDLNLYGIPFDIPLEVVLKGTRNGEPFEDHPDCTLLGRRIKLTCCVEVREHRVGPFGKPKQTTQLYAIDVPRIPGVDRLREGIVYLVLSPIGGSERGQMKLYLPELEVGRRNYFVWQEPPGYRLLKESPRRNEAIPEYNMFYIVYEA